MRLRCTVFLALLLSSDLPAYSRARATDRELIAVVDKLCDWTGLRRFEQPLSVGYGKYQTRDGHFYRIKMKLSVDGKVRPFRIFLNDDLTVRDFMREDWPFPAEYPEAGTRADTVKDLRLRTRLTEVISRLNHHLQFRFVQPPMIQRSGDSFVISFRQLSEEDQARIEKERGIVILHPYINFLVTSRGTVSGTWTGTVP